MRKNLKQIIAGSLIVGALVVGGGCSKNPIEVLNRHKCERMVEVHKGDTYWGYAKQLQKKYPQLNDLDIRDVWMYLRDYNNGKDLIAGDTIKLPNCYEFDE